MLNGYPPLPKGAVIGKSYKTRFGYVKLINRDVDAVLSHLDPWPDGIFSEFLYEPGILPRYGHRLTIDCLIRAYTFMCERALRYAEKHGIDNPTRGRIALTGFFRPLGTTWGEGKYTDLYGCIDARYDDYGHWYLAVDISRRKTAQSFHPRLAEGSVDLCMEKAGLARPWLPDETWHWRPKRSLRQAYADGTYQFIKGSPVDYAKRALEIVKKSF